MLVRRQRRPVLPLGHSSREWRLNHKELASTGEGSYASLVEGRPMSRARMRLPMTGLVSASLFFTGISYASSMPYAGIAAIDGLGMTEGTYALVLTVSSLVGAVASVGLGHLSDRIGDRRLLVLATALLGAIAFGLIYLLRTPLAYIIAY